jgi:predicted nucleic acid-binding protein
VVPGGQGGTSEIVHATGAGRPVIHLDTSFLIHGLVSGSREDSRIQVWLRAGEPLGMSVIAWAEFFCGPLGEQQSVLASRVLRDVASFTMEDSALAARLFNLSGRRRGTFIDCMIAATAIRSKAALATSNPADFQRFLSEGLELAG